MVADHNVMSMGSRHFSQIWIRIAGQLWRKWGGGCSTQNRNEQEMRQTRHAHVRQLGLGPDSIDIPAFLVERR